MQEPYRSRLNKIEEFVRITMAPLHTMCETVLHNCPHCFVYDDKTFVVGCDLKEWPIKIRKCWECYQERARVKR